MRVKAWGSLPASTAALAHKRAAEQSLRRCRAGAPFSSSVAPAQTPHSTSLPSPLPAPLHRTTSRLPSPARQSYLCSSPLIRWSHFAFTMITMTPSLNDRGRTPSTPLLCKEGGREGPSALYRPPPLISGFHGGNRLYSALLLCSSHLQEWCLPLPRPSLRDRGTFLRWRRSLSLPSLPSHFPLPPLSQGERTLECLF